MRSMAPMVGAMVVLVLLGVIGSRGLATVRPVRFDEELHRELGIADGNPFAVDPFLVEGSANNFGATPVAVPTSVIAQRCGDNDGCTLRLVFFQQFAPEAIRWTGRFLSTSDDALRWRVFELHQMTSSASGAADNGVSDVLVEIVFGDRCRLQDTASDGYELLVVASDLTTVRCSLRIDD